MGAFLVAHVLTFFQLNGQFLYKSFVKHEWAVAAAGGRPAAVAAVAPAAPPDAALLHAVRRVLGNRRIVSVDVLTHTGNIVEVRQALDVVDRDALIAVLARKPLRRRLGLPRGVPAVEGDGGDVLGRQPRRVEAAGVRQVLAAGEPPVVVVVLGADVEDGVELAVLELGEADLLVLRDARVCAPQGAAWR